jgi:hypothetical protein
MPQFLEVTAVSPVLIFAVFRTVIVQVMLFWVVTPYGLPGGYQHFGGCIIPV